MSDTGFGNGVRIVSSLALLTACSAPGALKRPPGSDPEPGAHSPNTAVLAEQPQPVPRSQKEPSGACEAPSLWAKSGPRWAPDWPAPLDERYVRAVIQGRTRIQPVVNPLDRRRAALPSLKRLLDRMPSSSPDRPPGFLRLARGYVDLSHEAFLEAQRAGATEMRCALFQESSEAVQKAELVLDELIEHPSAQAQRGAAMFLSASLFVLSDPARTIARCAQLLNADPQDKYAAACRLCIAEALSPAVTDAPRARQELLRVSKADRPPELYFIAQHRLAEIAWALHEPRQAVRHLERALASLRWAQLRGPLEQNLSYVRAAGVGAGVR